MHTLYALISELSPFAKSFLNKYQHELGFKIIPLTNFDALSKDGDPEISQTVFLIFLESSPSLRDHLIHIRSLNIKSLIVVFSEKLTLEDMDIAFEYRVYDCFDGGRTSEEILFNFKNIFSKVEEYQKRIKTMHSIKNFLLLSASDDASQSQKLHDIIRSTIEVLDSYASSEFIDGDDYLINSKGKEILKKTTPFFQKGMSLEELLLSVEALKLTGRLTVIESHQKYEGTFDFVEGELLETRLLEVEGEKAFFRIFLWENFDIQFTSIPLKELYLSKYNLKKNFQELSSSAKLLKDKFIAMQNDIPTWNSCYKIKPRVVTKNMDFSIEEFDVLTQIVLYQKVSSILNYSKLPDVLVLENILGLERKDVIEKIL